MSLFSYSFFASFHCAFMCGPLACVGAGGGQKVLWRTSLYNGARLVSYLTVASLLQLSIGGLLSRYSHFSVFFSASAGLVIIALGLILLMGKDFKFIDKFIPSGVFSWITKYQSSKKFPVILGLATGFLPCASLFPVYLMAAQSDSVSVALGGVVAFFLGTLPMMFFLPFVSRAFIDSLKLQHISKVAALFLLFAGLLTLSRAF
jgi:sulfite exporter TauE/SafE